VVLAAIGCASSHDPPGSTHGVPEGRLPPEETQGMPVDGGTLTVLLPSEPAHLLRLIEPNLVMYRMTVPNVY
jgi:hypothetical protein